MGQFRNHEAENERSTIMEYIKEYLTPYSMKGKEYCEKLQKEQEQLAMLDRSNPGYFSMLHDTRENIKMLMLACAPCLCIFVDVFVMFNGLGILCANSSMRGVAQLLVPVIFSAVEICIGYFSITEQRRSIHKPRTANVLQYCVICFLAAFSTLVIWHSVQGYDPQFDGDSKMGYLAGTAFIQFLLLVPSVLLHISILKFAEGIAESMAYFRYRMQRVGIANRVERHNKRRKKFYVQFVRMVQRLVEALDAFARKYTGFDGGFDRIVPYELGIAINTVMGRNVFDLSNRRNSVDNTNSIES